MTDPTTNLSRLRALDPSERKDLLKEMERGEVDAVLLRSLAAIEEAEDACLDYKDELKHYRDVVVPYYRRQLVKDLNFDAPKRSWWTRLWGAQ